MRPSLQSKTGDSADQQYPNITLDWAVFDWGMADCVDWIVLVQSGQEMTLAN